MARVLPNDFDPQDHMNQTWWHMPVMAAMGGGGWKLRNSRFSLATYRVSASQGYVTGSLNKTKQNTPKLHKSPQTKNKTPTELS